MNDDLTKLKEQFTPKPKPFKVLENKREFGAARFSPCGRFLFAAGYDGQVHRWDSSGDEFNEIAPALGGHNGWVQDVAFDAAAPAVYSVDTWGRLSRWDYAALGEQPQPKWSVETAHDGWITSVAVSPDGQLVATGGLDRAVRVWSAADGTKRHEFLAQPDDVLQVAFHPDGKSLVSGDLKGIVKLWDLASGQSTRQFDASVLYKLDRLQDVGGARCLAFNADGSLLFVAGTKPVNGGNVQGTPTVLAFDWAGGTVKHTLELGQAGDVYVCDLRFHSAGFLMAAISGNPGTGKLIFRRLDDKEAFFTHTAIANCHSLSLHPNGSRLAVAGTNGGSNGNGKVVDKDGEYKGNWSPIHILDLPKPE